MFLGHSRTLKSEENWSDWSSISPDIEMVPYTGGQLQIFRTPMKRLSSEAECPYLIAKVMAAWLHHSTRTILIPKEKQISSG